MPYISFIYPEALWLLIVPIGVAALALLAPRRLSLFRFWGSLIVRTLVAVALIFAFAGIQWVRPVDRLTTVFLLDGSDSMPASTRAQAEAFIRAALQEMPADDQAAIIVFGDNALVERAPDSDRRLGRITSIPIANRTNIESAIQLGMALFPADAQKRLVLLSDGGENSGRAIDAARLAASRGIPIDIVDLTLVEADAEALVSSVEAPNSVRDGQEALIVATVESNVAQSATVRLIDDTGVVAERTLELSPGATRVEFVVPVEGSGFRRYRVQVEAANDGRVQNNEAAALIRVQGPPRVLLIARNAADARPLATALVAADMVAEVISPEAAPRSLADLSAYDALVLVNTPARALPIGLMQAIPGYVRDLGRGLLMIGGEDSFGVGGYGRTAVEEALPVYMDVRNREMRPDLAIVFVIDKSGSMDACHCADPDRNAPITSSSDRKIDIAKDAIAQATALLSLQDTVGVVTFDGAAFPTFAATRGATVEQVMEAVAGVEPRGPTNIRAGLLRAEEMLQQVDARIKHMILLTDGWGSGGDQLDIAARLREQGITLTVVAAGSGSASYLQQLAAEGGGRYYPAVDMADVPQIFVQETITTIGNYIVEQPFVPVRYGSSPILAGISTIPPLYGYNGSTLKDTAQLLLATEDQQPILATWQFGLGRSAAWLSDSKGKWARDWIAWDGFPRFAAQLIEDLTPRGGQDVRAEVTVAGSETIVRLAMAASQNDLTVTATLIGGDGSRREVRLTQVAPNQYQARLESPIPGTYLVQIAGARGDRVVIQETAGMVVPYSSEYRSAQANPGLLAELANTTKGRFVTEPAEVFMRLNQVFSAQEIAFPLLLLALILLPIDIALRRLMVRRSDFGPLGTLAGRLRPAGAAPVAPDPVLDRLRAARDQARRQMVGERTPLPLAPPSASPPAPPPAAAAEGDEALARLRAAKERARKRITGEGGE
ncbi:VWA domain-containing protein [Chloroflexus sp.]|uniref:VWA domain-containing protein n=1 Tax=Chloroflexus sp. TaxID=1904827 RepID=UPI002ACE9A06|nr:VWA domain-containing protein [Chloroflexus sp.]